MRDAPFGLRPCKVRKPLKIRDVASVERYIFIRAEVYPPSSVANATNCLQFSSLSKGKAFCENPFVLYDKEMSGRIYTRPHPSPTASPSPSKGKAFGGSADFKKVLQPFGI